MRNMNLCERPVGLRSCFLNKPGAEFRPFTPNDAGAIGRTTNVAVYSWRDAQYAKRLARSYK